MTTRLLAFACLAWLANAGARAAEDAALIEAAKKEGSVTWYTSQIIDELARPAANAFQKKYGIKVDFVRAGSSEIATRLVNEARAKRVMGDVIDTSTASLALKRENVLLKWLPADAARLPKHLVDPEGYWTAGTASVMTLGYNTSLVPPGTQPKTFEDLLDPKWKGRIAWSTLTAPSGAPGFVGTVLTTMGEAKGMDYLRKLAAQRIANVPQTARQVLNQVIAGEYALALQMFNKHAAISAAAGAPVAWSALDASMAYVVVFSVPAGSPHPNAGKLFASFMTSRDGQEVFRDADYAPIDPEVPDRTPELRLDNPALRANFFAPETLEASIPAWTRIFKDLFQ